MLRLNWGGGKRPALGGPSGMGGMAPSGAAPAISETSLFVGDLPFDVNDAMLFAVFSVGFPSCTSAKVRAGPALP